MVCFRKRLNSEHILFIAVGGIAQGICIWMILQEYKKQKQH